MSRPTDWMPLRDTDPVPGDQVQIQAMAKRYRDFAAELEAQAASLNRLANAEGWDAIGGRAFASTATDVAGQLSKAKGRYQAVGDAISTYATALAQAQQEADDAAREAKQAEAEVKAKQAAGDATNALDDPMAQALNGPTRRLRAAMDRRDSADRQAAAQVRDAIDSDGLKDNWWDRVKDWTSKNWNSFIDWVHKHAGTINGIADWMGKISSALAVIGTVLSFIPVVNAIAPAFFAVAAGLTVISLVCHILTALSGDGSLVSIGLDVLGLVTFGWGKAATAGAKTAQAGLKAAAKTGFVRQAKGAATKKAAAKISENARKAVVNGGVRRARAEAGKLIDEALSKPASSFIANTNKWLVPRQAKVDKLVNSRIGKFLQMDSDVVYTTAQHKAIEALAPKYNGVKNAMAEVQKKVGQADLANAIGIAGDIADKSKAASLLDKYTTFGRYANK
ncbi:hypothetical protein [Kineosporia succinea]|uniref:WXG100 family type VII secretion target n=1 Tax=Kineosporia succinea TaxID=84632 RepID=A0ABT9P5G3_9ACTN|nr:hypothetical protein [Kineosporia succinea]MDP9827913.1 hypothetical protein [Kineosporia succinea]